MDYISLINLWCQKWGKLPPIYEYLYDASQTNHPWLCYTIWSPNADIVPTECANTSKKLAKQAVAQLLYDKYCRSEDSNRSGVPIITLSKKTTLLIDGDQRSDVLKYLNKTNIPDGLKIHVYVSPCTQSIDVDNTKFEYHVAKTTSKDSADAMMLMDLGRLLYLNSDLEEIIIVSSDHILVQAAQDNSIRWAKNLQDLQKLFSN